MEPSPREVNEYVGPNAQNNDKDCCVNVKMNFPTEKLAYAKLRKVVQEFKNLNFTPIDFS